MGVSDALYGIDGLTLGERLRRARLKARRTALDIAFAIEMRSEQVSRWEHDVCIPSLPAFAALAEQYHVPMDALFWGPLPPDAASRADSEGSDGR
jgi:transcriptional regulator with XRE-family HTH domain